MADKTLLSKYLPEDLIELAMKFVIPQEFLEDTPDLIEMVLRSRSIDTHEEKQNWFNLLPLMNVTQIEKLRAILVKERTKLAEIEKKYEQKKLDIKKKYLTKRQEMWYVKQKEALKKKEESATQKDEAEAEALLAWI